MIQLLKYGNTNTYYIKGTNGSILVDTDWAGTLQAFYKKIKELNITILYQDKVIFSKSLLVILDSSLAFNYLEMTGEQLNRMGEGIEYTATSFIKINVDSEHESNLTDLGGNFRFGVFNSEIPEENVESYSCIGENSYDKQN